MFDRDRFSEILTNIVAQYDSITDFANTSKVGRSYLSKYINLKLDSPPSPKVLEKIAKNSRELVTYEELMIICGHIDNSSSINSVNLDILRILNNDKNLIYKDAKKLSKLEQRLLQSTINEFNLAIMNNFSFNIDNVLGKSDIETRAKVENLFSKYEKAFYKYSSAALSSTCYVPIITKIDNPEHIYVADNILDYTFLSEDFRPSNEFIAYLCNDNKMFPLLGENDIAIIHLENKIVEHSTCLVYIKEKNICEIGKLLLDKNNNLELLFMNPNYPTEHYNINNINIIGKVVRVENSSAFK